MPIQTIDDGSGTVVAIDESSNGVPTSDNSSGSTISNGGTSPHSGTIEPMSESESGSTEQTTNTDKSNQSSSTTPSDTNTENHDPAENGNSISFSIDSNITSLSLFDGQYFRNSKSSSGVHKSVGSSSSYSETR